MILSGFKTRRSDIVWGVESSRPHKATVQKAGEFPVADIKVALQDPSLKQKYRSVFEKMVKDHPDGKLPAGEEVYNYCVAAALSLGIKTCNANVDMFNDNGEKIGIYLGSRARDFVGKNKSLPTVTVIQPLQLPQKTNPKPKSLDDRIKILEKYRGNIYNTRYTATRLVRRGQEQWSSVVRAENPKCLITGIVKSNVLEAAHIKPHARFPEPDIALNPNNGFMISRSLHPSFDNGEWSLDKGGKITLSPLLTKEDVADLAKLGLVDGVLVDQNVFDSRSDYFDWHYNNVFKK